MMNGVILNSQNSDAACFVCYDNYDSVTHTNIHSMNAIVYNMNCLAVSSICCCMWYILSIHYHPNGRY